MLNDGAGTRDLSSATKQSIARWPSTRVDKARYHHSTRGGSANTRETIVWQCLIRIRWLSSGVKAKCRWATADKVPESICQHKAQCHLVVFNEAQKGVFNGKARQYWVVED